MGKTWKQFKGPKAPRLDREEERRACRGRVVVEEEEEYWDEGEQEIDLGALDRPGDVLKV